MLSCQCRNFEDKTILRLSYLYHGNPVPGKMIFIYKQGLVQVNTICYNVGILDAVQIFVFHISQYIYIIYEYNSQFLLVCQTHLTEAISSELLYGFLPNQICLIYFELTECFITLVFHLPERTIWIYITLLLVCKLQNLLDGFLPNSVYMKQINVFFMETLGFWLWQTSQ